MSTIYNDYNGNITDANVSASAAIAGSKVVIAANQITPTMRTGGYFVGNFTPTGTGNKAITGVGFTPKLVKFSALPANSTTFQSGSVGVMTTLAQFTTATAQDTTATHLAQYSSTANCISTVSSTSITPTQLATYVSMDADGFTVNFSIQNGTVVGYECYA